MSSSSEPVLVLHDMGEPAGGRPWRTAFEHASWPGPVVAPDLPGHATEPAPVGGQYEPLDPAVFAVSLTGESGPATGGAVVVGIGVSGWSAQVLALGGRATALVLVDGLNGPWADPRETIAAGRDWLRAVAADPRAVAPPPASGFDPRLAHGVLPHRSRALAERAAAAMPVPVLLIETPASPLALGDAEGLAARFPAGATLLALEDAAPVVVAERATLWRCQTHANLGSTTPP